MYCGENLPAGIEGQATLPENLDELVGNALKSGSLGGLRAGLASESIGEPAPTVPEAVVPPESMAALLERLVNQSQAAQHHWSQGQTEQTRVALQTMANTTSKAQEQLPSTPPQPMLSPPRPFGLIVGGFKDESVTDKLMGALGIDGVTARQLALSRSPRAARWAHTARELHADAQALKQGGIPCSIITLDLPVDPWMVLSWNQQLTLRQAPCWFDVDALGPEQVRPPPTEVVLLVEGQVTTKRERPAQQTSRLIRKKGPDQRDLGESRVGVVDLWSEHGVIRVVEGLTRLPGDTGSSTQDYRAFLKELLEMFPGAVHTPARVCRWSEVPASPQKEGGPPVRSGWPLFEQHTRVCWAHYLAKVSMT